MFVRRLGKVDEPQPVRTRERLGEALVARGLLSREQLERALDYQRRTGDRLGRILIALGYVRRQQLYQVLAELWGYPFVDLLCEPLDLHLARRFDPETLVQRRCFPVRVQGSEVWIATAEPPSRELEEFVQAVLGPVRVRPLVTTEWDIDHAIRRVFRDVVLDRASLGLYFRNPDESARQVLVRWQKILLWCVIAGLVFSLLVAPRLTAIVISAVVNGAMFAYVVFRFVVAMVGAQHEHVQAIQDDEVRALRDDELPMYTVLVPVYREANVVGHLIENLRRLDYPHSKLEILLLIEEDDVETLHAAKAARPPETVTFIVVPDGVPKTKPKACNVGLLFARGEFLTIYDAEDRPDPDQLKKAVVAFRKGPPELVCVQAALNYYNATENLLTRMFTLEYSDWFDYVLTGLDRLRLPIPLGGTSNHFRVDRLRELGGWDPFNVTEDADLGIRAAAHGYRVGVINSTTWEEANTRVGNWIRQRSRWIKGYLQTLLVHSRHPVRLVRTAGLRNTLAFILLIGGAPFAFLSLIPLWSLTLVWVITRTHAFDILFPPLVLYISLFNLLIGNGLMIYLGMMAGFKRRRYELIPFALLNPFYWVLHSIAAYKAVWQLITKPFYWEKTQHGLSRYLQSRPVAEHTS
ncbi:glycosyltransferase [Thermomicrobium sp. 4228-Ro]|uniref:glycosyltransferase family 2 protein n=1 Tax=Thermomicrobium sp. 4228-Ro TaxID=2993937 RepID=UPI0022490642|nr:glycosyltransferase [Thermomicrobium sp. 4228-Ro]MCX2727608.1 glycosyltransferase [Thermomicrobium sp. 4228-Ro]